ncbi:hypothetical protein MSM1_08505 [Mycobacterium sp. SM1]|uniref:hypothetical protein n=1 Tax=Mycobacterium sp. SM1 TaxID=2816243 RepID=UPI001BCAE227|nr:hypothetical protein [Mycobacterium sp. SM1]MBS4728378.1 hypothetical protein [Mycobacterium sp. SM1]
MNGWLGEVQGLQTSLDAAAKKLVVLDRAIAQTSRATNLGIPVVADASPTIQATANNIQEQGEARAT